MAFSPWDLAIWRFIGGVAIGAASVIAPAYIAEVAPAAMRGRLGSLQQLAIVFGIFAALLSDTLLARIAGANEDLFLGLQAWRWMFMAAVVPAVARCFAARIPESPRCLIRRGRDDDARAVLRQILPPMRSTLKLREIHELDQCRGAQQPLRPQGPPLRSAADVWVDILLSIFQQFVGITVTWLPSTTPVRSSASKTRDHHQHHHVGGEHRDDVGCHRHDRPGRPQAPAAHRFGRHDGHDGPMAIVFFTAPDVNNDFNSPVSGAIVLIAANLYVVFFGMS